MMAATSGRATVSGAWPTTTMNTATVVTEKAVQAAKKTFAEACRKNEMMVQCKESGKTPEEAE